MKTIFSYKKDAVKFSAKERDILMTLIEFFKHEIPDGNGSYLSMLDLDKIDFYWCPAMKDTDVLGAWVLLKYTLYLLESDGTMLSTIFHELYHKWQYKVTGPLYVVNCLVFMLTGYEFSTKSKHSIEGDVRVYIDNDALHKAVGKFYERLYKYLWIKDRMNRKQDEDYSAELSELEKDELINEIVRKLQPVSLSVKTKP